MDRLNWFPQESPAVEEPPALAMPLKSSLLGLMSNLLGEGSVTQLDEADFQEPEKALALFLPAQARNLAAALRQAATHPCPSKSADIALDEGWALAWIEAAKGAGSELERRVFGNFLAQQCLQPGAVSRRTLAGVRVMDVWELESFQFYAAFAFEFESGWRFLFEGDLAKKEMWVYGRELDAGSHWIDQGFLVAEPHELRGDRNLGLEFSYRGAVWRLDGFAKEGAARASVPYRRLTMLGQQLASAMTLKSYRGYARNLVQAIQAASSLSIQEVSPDDAIS